MLETPGFEPGSARFSCYRFTGLDEFPSRLWCPVGQVAPSRVAARTESGVRRTLVPGWNSVPGLQLHATGDRDLELLPDQGGQAACASSKSAVMQCGLSGSRLTRLNL